MPELLLSKSWRGGGGQLSSLEHLLLFAEELSSVPSTHRGLTPSVTISSSRGSDTIFWVPQTLHAFGIYNTC